MSFATYFQQEILMPRLARDAVLVVHDFERRYRDLCLRLVSDGIQVVDATASSIESGDSAIRSLAQMGQSGSDVEGLLVYVPARRPIADEDRQRDPFALYSVCGGTFPDGDGDEYLSLCLKAKPDHATEIRRIFAEDPSPAFADELWRFLLYSEFAFDLPGTLPDALDQVPRAPDAARPLEEDLCERLRNDQRTRQLYIDRAEIIEQDLSLPELCAELTDLGSRDTFPFEERTFLAWAVKALGDDCADEVRGILQRQSGSVWVGKGEHQAQWGLVEAALHLIEACDDYERQLPDHARTQGTLIDFYLASLREVDRHQREFERAVCDHLDIDGAMAEVIERARSRYRRLGEKVQLLFTKHLETSGWPPSGRLANADVFDTLVAPKLKESGRRVALFLIDALRYELGVALQQQLAEDEPVELTPAYAQLPSVTQIGMASLLPGAGKSLSVVKKGDGFVPMLGETAVANVNQRLDVLRKQYGIVSVR